MKEDVVELQKLAELKESDIGPSEENVTHKILRPLLELLGHSVNDLDFEYHTQSGKRIDIFIKNLYKDRKVIIETKKYSEDLSEHVDQIKEYVYEENALIAILANGSEIRIYSPLRGVAFERSLLYQISRKDLTNQEVWQTISGMLSRDALSQGGTLDRIDVREREIKEAMGEEDRLNEEHKQQTENLQVEVEELEDKIDMVRSKTTELSKMREENVKKLWENIGLPAELSELERKNILTISSQTEYQRKAGRVTLEELVTNGFLKDRQKLYFYNTRPFNEETAEIVSNLNRLKYLSDGKLYSISDLAKQLLIKHGFKKDQHGVSGPKYWKTDDGKFLDTLNFEVRKKRGY